MLVDGNDWTPHYAGTIWRKNRPMRQHKAKQENPTTLTPREFWRLHSASKCSTPGKQNRKPRMFILVRSSLTKVPYALFSPPTSIHLRQRVFLRNTSAGFSKLSQVAWFIIRPYWKDYMKREKINSITTSQPFSIPAVNEHTTWWDVKKVATTHSWKRSVTKEHKWAVQLEAHNENIHSFKRIMSEDNSNII